MQGFNMGRYRPPDSDPRKESFNSLTGTNPYGKRGRQLDKGILVVRFELPFNIWCGHCDTHIGQGVRFNAEKSKVGNYFSTPIYRFRCKTTCCQHYFSIETDPKHARYVVVEGAKAQAQVGDEQGADTVGDLLVLDDGTGDRGAGSSLSKKTDAANEDAFSKLDRDTTAERLAQTRRERLEALEASSKRSWADPYERNCQLRNGFRKEKRVRQAREADDEAMRERLGWTEGRKLIGKEEMATPDVRRQWIEARSEAGLLTSSSSSSSSKGGSCSTPLRSPGSSKFKKKQKAPTAAQKLADRLASNSRRKQDPFGLASSAPVTSLSSKQRSR